MPDALYEDPRLAALYDVFDDDRSDLDLYVSIALDLDVERVADLGCGTGVLALWLAGLGLHVTGVDPARASLDVARSKPGADRVEWRLGDAAAALGTEGFDLVTMTGNTVQALLGDAWPRTIADVSRALSTDGHFVFESRIPARRAWESWTPELTRQRREVLGTGFVETWTEVTDVSEPLVSFRHTYRLPDGSELTSDSTIEFRTLDQLTDSLGAGGFEVVSVRDAPDRPGLEYVVVAQRCRAVESDRPTSANSAEIGGAYRRDVV